MLLPLNTSTLSSIKAKNALNPVVVTLMVIVMVMVMMVIVMVIAMVMIVRPIIRVVIVAVTVIVESPRPHIPNMITLVAMVILALTLALTTDTVIIVKIEAVLVDLIVFCCCLFMFSVVWLRVVVVAFKELQMKELEGRESAL